MGPAGRGIAVLQEQGHGIEDQSRARWGTGQWGYLAEKIRSDRVTEGPIFELCRRMNPGFDFDEVQVNKFLNHKQCQMHYDKHNVGESRIAMCGPFKGGALRLEGGKRFDQKRVWYQYNGALTRHGVAPFRGERYSVVLFKRRERMCAMCGLTDFCDMCFPGHSCCPHEPDKMMTAKSRRLRLSGPQHCARENRGVGTACGHPCLLCNGTVSYTHLTLPTS